jgi:hypothetical protein
MAMTMAMAFDYDDDYDLGNAEDADRADLRGGFFEYIKIICVRGQLRVES